LVTAVTSERVQHSLERTSSALIGCESAPDVSASQGDRDHVARLRLVRTTPGYASGSAAVEPDVIVSFGSSVGFGFHALSGVGTIARL
jgi:hypothetical protein